MLSHGSTPSLSSNLSYWEKCKHSEEEQATDGDLRRLVVRGECDVERPLAEYMVRTPRTARPEDSAAQALDLMEEKAITVLPVVDGEGRVAGVAHLHDLLGQGGVKFSG